MFGSYNTLSVYNIEKLQRSEDILKLRSGNGGPFERQR